MKQDGTKIEDGLSFKETRGPIRDKPEGQTTSELWGKPQRAVTNLKKETRNSTKTCGLVTRKGFDIALGEDRRRGDKRKGRRKEEKKRDSGAIQHLHTQLCLTGQRRDNLVGQVLSG